MFSGTLERNQFITLAHINPESFNQLESHREPNTLCSMWFIGLEFAKTENLNVNLTYDIQQFTETVQNHAININMFKEGMKLEAKHVKRKQLYQYVSPPLIKRERLVSASKSNVLDLRKSRMSDPGSGEAEAPQKKQRLSDEIHSTNVCF